ncbi:hypothetical protein [Roseococcus pinisoli]|uniref:Uncharacterized protein n=1 Tax=Roseococcus pinisoli TaxID=2835040 RepID=A0ABS5QGY3_9PROT|nr:hypothetical protein [Roseococcus pinisoli]
MLAPIGYVKFMFEPTSLSSIGCAVRVHIRQGQPTDGGMGEIKPAKPAPIAASDQMAGGAEVLIDRVFARARAAGDHGQ